MGNNNLFDTTKSSEVINGRKKLKKVQKGTIKFQKSLDHKLIYKNTYRIVILKHQPILLQTLSFNSYDHSFLTINVTHESPQHHSKALRKQEDCLLEKRRPQ